MPFSFDNSYARLPEGFFTRLPPAPVAAPRLLRLNRPLARELGLDPDRLEGPEGAALFSGNRLPAGAEPLAMAYAGHQFGGWVPQLGDGRAILLGEVIDRHGARRDIQLKGAGPTPFSRNGDGRAALGPVMREYIVSEGMAALGVPTTRALAMTLTGEKVFRERAYPGAVLCRVAASHIRIGTFQFFAARRNETALRQLCTHALARHYPDRQGAASPALALLEGVIARQAELVAHWHRLGFIHGVMNTDNMAISGETIDYGPCAFMDAYHPGTVFSSIDHDGRYAFENQPRIALWNLTRFAETLLPLLSAEEDTATGLAQAALDRFPDLYHNAWLGHMRRKLGLLRAEDEDRKLAEQLLDLMAENRADFTLTFSGLRQLPRDGGAAEKTENTPVRGLFRDPAAFDGWAAAWRARLARETAGEAERQALMRAANPVFIPRNHLVEEAIRAAEDRNGLQPCEDLLTVLASPCDNHPALARLAAPPRPDQLVRRTFCGT